VRQPEYRVRTRPHASHPAIRNPTETTTDTTAAHQPRPADTTLEECQFDVSCTRMRQVMDDMRMPAPVTLHGHLVRLELMRPDHIDGLWKAATEDRSTYDYTYVPRDLEAVNRYVALASSDFAAGTAVPFTTIAIDQATGEERVVGTSRLRELEYWRAGVWPPRLGHVNPDGVPDAAEIGSTWLSPTVQRTGVNIEAKLLMLAYAFENWDVHRVSLKTDVRNTRSRAAISALGAQFEGIRRAHFPAADGGTRDSALFSIVRAEWAQAKANLEARLERYLTMSASTGAALPAA
jgi:N-acetyltransferase